ncbi:MAG TPA: type IV pilus biogenesis/stability protein PilW [Rhodanobacteraceae bacterium]|nr:type IV pilus biogenesis/stability protein PilW [Rhodanobacteraceae bacterium]
MRRNGLFIALLGAALVLTGCATGGGNGMQRAHTPSARENAASIHTELAWNLMKQGKLEMALSKLQTALQFDSDYVPTHTVLGVLYTRINKPAKAEEQYRRAVELDPTDGDTNNNLGRFLCQEGRTSEGLPYFKKALADPFYKTRTKALTNAGTCQIRAGDYKQAEASLREALKINPNDADALYQMARAHYLQGDAFHASAYIQRFLALGVTNPAVLKLGYDIESRLGNAEGARKYARQLRTTFPDSEQAQALDSKASP